MLQSPISTNEGVIERGELKEMASESYFDDKELAVV